MKTLPLVLGTLLALTACSDDGGTAAPAPLVASAAAPSPAAAAAPTGPVAHVPAAPGAPGQPGVSAQPAGPDGATVVVTAGRSGPVRAEVADDEQERAVGLMARTSVPLGTGMVFRFPAAVQGQFYMFRTLVPLTSVFARDGRVVGVYDMVPCASQVPDECARYGPKEEFDTVLETAPETLRGKVAVGDRLTVG